MERRDDFISELRRLFEEIQAFTGMISGGGPLHMPSNNTLSQPYEEAIETDDAYILTLELAGAEPADVRVHASHHEITVDGGDGSGEGFTLTYPTETPIQPRKLKVTLKNGFLEIKAPKK
jgi:HSP20 family molecular chaperone IbpA